MKCILIIDDMPDGKVDIKVLRQLGPGELEKMTPANALLTVSEDMLRMLADDARREKLAILKQREQSCLH